MGCFVHHQAAGILFLAVPAAEIIGAVTGIEHPVKIDGEDVADGPLHEQILDLGARRRIAIVEGCRAAPARLFDRFEDGAAFFGVGGHRLFSDDIASQLHGTDNILVMESIHCGDNHRLRPGFCDHPVEIAGSIDGWFRLIEGARVALRPLQAAVIGIA